MNGELMGICSALCEISIECGTNELEMACCLHVSQTFSFCVLAELIELLAR